MKTSGEGDFAPIGEVAPAPAAPIIKRGAVSRNALLIVAGVIILAVTVGLIWYAMSLANNSPVAPITTVVLPPTPAGGGSTGSTTTAAPGPIVSIDNRDVFTPRNPFTVILPIEIAVPESDTSDNSDNNTETADTTTLTLRDIVTVDGVRKAVVRLAGVTYTLAAGETVGSSQWSIVEVNTNNIVALYGDVRVTISLGSK
jgi:hypothetical protein